MVVAGGLGRGRAPKKPQKTRTWREGGSPSYKRVRGESYTAVGKKNGARAIGTFGHEILKAKHLEKRRCEGAYRFTKSGTGEGLSPPASPLLSAPSSSSPALLNSGRILVLLVVGGG